VLLGMLSCVPTGPTPLNARAQAFLALAQCYGEAKGIEGITLTLFDRARPYCDTYVACAAWPGTTNIECWREFMEGEEYADVPLEGYAAHEVCHLSGIASEVEAEACAFYLVRDTKCEY